MPLIIGLTGGIASGKTKVSDYFASQYGIDIVDADVVAREVVAIGMPALNQIQSRFGDAILDPQGQLNRARLREIIFQNPEEKHWLESLLHPLIRQSMQQQLTQATSPYAILVAPLLIENKLQSMVDRILVVNVSKQTQIERTMARDQVSKQHVESILQAQVSQEERLSFADDVIDNDQEIAGQDLSPLYAQIDALHRNYLDLSKPLNSFSSTSEPK